MATVDELAARILAASGDDEFPARIDTSAGALADLARARLNANQALFILCQSLNASTDTRYFGANKTFTDDDGKLIGFFLLGSSV